MTKCAIYTRVSTATQVEKGYSLDAQEKIGVDVCKQRGWAYEVFREEGKSADKEGVEHRPELKKILDLIEDGEFQYCFITELDRLSRNPATLYVIKKIFSDNDVKAVTTNQIFDFKDDEDDFMSDLLGLLAKRENRLRSKRSKRGKVEAMQKGRWTLTFAPFGYMKNGDGRLEEDKEESSIYRLMVSWCLEGKGSGEIARKLTAMGTVSKGTKVYKKGKTYKWHSQTVRRMLRSDLYIGQFEYKGKNVEGIPALISKDIWGQVQSQLSSNYKNAKRNTKRFYLLRGLLYCNKCGRRLYGLIKPSRGMRCYCCLSKRPDPEPRFCGLKNVPLDKIEILVWKKVGEMIKNSSLIKKRIETGEATSDATKLLLEAQEKKLEEAVDKKNREIDNVLSLRGKIKALSIEEIDKVIREKKETREMLVKDLETARKNKVNDEQIKQSLSLFKNYMKVMSHRLSSLTEDEKYELLHLIINRIMVDYSPDDGHTIDIKIAVPILEETLPPPLNSRGYWGDRRRPHSPTGGSELIPPRRSFSR